MKKRWLLPLLLAAACSTPPQNPGEVYVLRKQAESQLDLGNKQADRGSYGPALVLLDEAWRLAVAADSQSLRVRTGLSRGNVLFALGRREEAAEVWRTALDEAEKMPSPELTAVSRIHIARGRLLSPGGDMAAAAQSVQEETSREMARIKNDRLYIAFAWTVIALAEKELGRFAEAEAAVKGALELHEKGRHFEQAAYDWFLIASIRSFAKNYSGAAAALEAAMAFDRRVENSWGLAADWRALGDIYKKAGNAEAARGAYLRSAEIFRSIGSNEAANETENRQ
ncbi:MAG: hypothetical protein LBD48_03905 [Treponema sp.]|jgi:tetratricopeptide (TPR) repeat protein|nr:hypothetical protein [Treponema sp.]